MRHLRSAADNRFAKIVFSLCLEAALIGCHGAFANSRKLSEDWEQFTLMKGEPLGLRYKWIRDGDDRAMHESNLFATLNGNEMFFYYAQEIDPFGGFSRCGGFPCWLQAGPKLGSLVFEKIGSQLRVGKATGKISFLKGAKCRLLKYNDIGGMQLTCRKQNGPYLQGGDKVIDVNSTYHFIDDGT